MNNFDLYLNTHVFFGREAASNIPQNINCYGNRVLMVYGGGSIFKNGVYEEVTTILQNGGIEYIELGGIDPNPRICLCAGWFDAYVGHEKEQGCQRNHPETFQGFQWQPE